MRSSALIPQPSSRPRHRALSPSDFGLHNAMRDEDGRLRFIDFEYFGWDDPVKLVSDTALHPGSELPGSSAKRLIATALARIRSPGRRVCDPPGRAVSCVRVDLVPDRPERLFAGKPLPACHGRQGGDQESTWPASSTKLGGSIKRFANVIQISPHAEAAHTCKLDERSLYLRRLVLGAVRSAGRGHVGPALSLIEMVRVLYDDMLRIDPKNPRDPERDRAILSKGHGCLALYALLADRGFFPLSELDGFCGTDSILGGHPEYGMVPGVEASTGALGHGLSIGVGLALAARMRGRSLPHFRPARRRRDQRGFGLGGRHGRGQARARQSRRADRLQQAAELRADRLRAAAGTARGQMAQLRLCGARSSTATTSAPCAAHCGRFRRRSGRPTAIICHTVKGKGLPAAESNADWHHKNKLTEPRAGRHSRRGRRFLIGCTHAQYRDEHGPQARRARRAGAVHRLRSRRRHAARDEQGISVAPSDRGHFGSAYHRHVGRARDGRLSCPTSTPSRPS